MTSLSAISLFCTETRADRSKKLFRHYTVGSYDGFDASSDCIIEDKTVVLQKKDNEGFGFVLRGAKADTPIEEFTPTPAFPALQYLESVDEGGVAWQAGLRTGDFLIECVRALASVQISVLLSIPPEGMCYSSGEQKDVS
ncbi:hypothetical protein GHT09_020455 [Marmota monax]|uniref:PDZ domain-containing protein n=1 Tax=Marmota monax TaxID=9995 RepID=A0A834PHP6_MARMO|nr:hypothetical protein GHT09_020455 [Marmota monax]